MTPRKATKLKRAKRPTGIASTSSKSRFIGASLSTRASDAIQRQRTTVASHEWIGIFRIFGRDAGFTALYTGLRHLDPLCRPRLVTSQKLNY